MSRTNVARRRARHRPRAGLPPILGPRERAVIDAARQLAEVEAVRSDQTEHSSIWLHGHRTAARAVADAVDALDAPAILKVLRPTATLDAPATTDGAHG